MRGLLGGVLIAVLAACGSAAPSTSTSPAATDERPSKNPTPSLPTTVTPATSPTPLLSAQPSSPAPAPSANLGFTRAVTIAGAQLMSVTAFDGGFVAGGCMLDAVDPRCAEALLLHSSDGREWVETEVPGGAGFDVLRVASTSLGLLALGSHFGDEPPGARSIWRSDDGLNWEPFQVPAPPSIVFEHTVGVGDQTVLFGSDTAYDLYVQTEVWANNGGSWTSGTTPMVTKVAGRPGIVGIGEECVDVCPDDLPLRLYRSPDAFTWELDPDDPPFAHADISASGTWNGNALFVAFDFDDPTVDSTVWIDQPDGWHPAQLDGSSDFAITVILDIDGRLLVLGRRDSDNAQRAWWTNDGATWAREAVDGGVDGYIRDGAGGNPIVLVVGDNSLWTSSS